MELWESIAVQYLYVATVAWILAFTFALIWSFVEWRASARLLRELLEPPPPGSGAAGRPELTADLARIARSARAFSWWLFFFTFVCWIIGVQAGLALLLLPPPRPDVSLYTAIFRTEFLAFAVSICVALYHRRKMRVNSVGFIDRVTNGRIPIFRRGAR